MFRWHWLSPRAGRAACMGILWGTLVLGLCVPGAMAWQLYRQIK
jgi:hypothetical protein